VFHRPRSDPSERSCLTLGCVRTAAMNLAAISPSSRRSRFSRTRSGPKSRRPMPSPTNSGTAGRTPAAPSTGVPSGSNRRLVAARRAAASQVDRGPPKRAYIASKSAPSFDKAPLTISRIVAADGPSVYALPDRIRKQRARAFIRAAHPLSLDAIPRRKIHRMPKSAIGFSTAC